MPTQGKMRRGRNKGKSVKQKLLKAIQATSVSQYPRPRSKKKRKSVDKTNEVKQQTDIVVPKTGATISLASEYYWKKRGLDQLHELLLINCGGDGDCLFGCIGLVALVGILKPKKHEADEDHLVEQMENLNLNTQDELVNMTMCESHANEDNGCALINILRTLANCTTCIHKAAMMVREWTANSLTTSNVLKFVEEEEAAKQRLSQRLGEYPRQLWNPGLLLRTVATQKTTTIAGRRLLRPLQKIIRTSARLTSRDQYWGNIRTLYLLSYSPFFTQHRIAFIVVTSSGKLDPRVLHGTFSPAFFLCLYHSEPTNATVKRRTKTHKQKTTVVSASASAVANVLNLHHWQLIAWQGQVLIPFERFTENGSIWKRLAEEDNIQLKF